MVGVLLTSLTASCSPTSEQEIPFRQIREQDFCSALRVYDQPRASRFVGFLEARYPNYRDPHSGAQVDAILLRAMVDGKIVNVYRSKDEVLTWYVDARTSGADCNWFVRDRQPYLSTSDIHTSDVLSLASPGRWSKAKKSVKL